MRCLDSEIYALVKKKVANDIPYDTLVVDQTGELETVNCLTSRPQIRSIAVVDRTADVQLAAKHIVASYAAFHGRSPHSPDLVLVNEWIKKDFIDACIRFSSESVTKTKPPTGDWRNVVADAERNQQVSLIGTTSLTILDIHNR